MKYTEKIANNLNELLEKNYDAEKGYKEAESNVDNVALKTFFKEQATLRNNFGNKLKEEIKSFGATSDKESTIKGSLHRTWMNLKSTFSGNNEEAMLKEINRGEKAAIEEYNEIISENKIPASTKELLIEQRNAIQTALNNIKRFEPIVS